MAGGADGAGLVGSEPGGADAADAVAGVGDADRVDRPEPGAVGSVVVGVVAGDIEQDVGGAGVVVDGDLAAVTDATVTRFARLLPAVVLRLEMFGRPIPVG